MINENYNDKWECQWQSSIDIEGIGTVFIFFNEKNSKHLKHKQKHLK